MSAAADTDGSGFKSQGAHHHFQYPVCVVPAIFALNGGTQQASGCGSTIRTARTALRERGLRSRFMSNSTVGQEPTEPERKSNRRPGPIGFHGEGKVTAQRHGPGSNEGGIAEAAGPTRETPQGSRELKVVGVGVWAVVGAVVLLLGFVLLNPAVATFGVLMIVGAFFANQKNRTDSRLRDEAFKRDDK